MFRRFQPLIVTTASVRFANSSSLNCFRAFSNTSSGTWREASGEKGNVGDGI